MDVTDRQIYQAAIDLLHQVGSGFTMEQLVDKANVPRATLYRRVGSKDALLQRLVHEQGIALSPQHDVRTRILQAARQIFGRHGLANATMEQIADEAGVGVATVYRHFGDKDRLIWTLVAELSPRPFVRDFVDPSENVAADLLTLTKMLLAAFYEYRDILRLILTGVDAERAYIERLRTGSDHTLDQIAAYFAAQIEAGRVQSGGSPHELALAFMGLLFAFAVIGPAHYNTVLDDLERTAQLIIRIFLEGLKPISRS